MVSRWSPGGCLETLLSASMGASSWTGQTWGALLASAAYIVVFAGVGHPLVPMDRQVSL